MSYLRRRVRTAVCHLIELSLRTSETPNKRGLTNLPLPLIGRLALFYIRLKVSEVPKVFLTTVIGCCTHGVATAEPTCTQCVSTRCHCPCEGTVRRNWLHRCIFAFPGSPFHSSECREIYSRLVAKSVPLGLTAMSLDLLFTTCQVDLSSRVLLISRGSHNSHWFGLVLHSREGAASALL